MSLTSKRKDLDRELVEEKPLRNNECVEDKEDMDATKAQKKTYSKAFRHILKNITVEPTMIIYIISDMLVAQSTQNLSLDKACRVNLNFTTEICDSLRKQTLESQNMYEKETQKLLATYLSYRTFLQATIPTFIALCAGSFSDKVGRRKVFLIFTNVGQILTCTSNFINAYFFYELKLEVLIFSEALIDGLFGSWCVAIASIFSFISAVTREDERTFRMGLVNFSMTVGFPIGMAFSGVLLKTTGYYGCYGVAISLQLLNFTYNTFILKDPKRTLEQKQHDNRGVRHILRTFFDLSNIRESIHMVFKKGPNNRRLRMCVMMMTANILYGPIIGEMNVLYMNTRYRFNWDEVRFSVFQTYNFITHTIGTIFSITVLSKYLQWHDSILGIISTLSKIAASFFYCFAPNEKIFFIGPLVEILSGTSILAMRSIISKLVAPNELGRVNSIFGLTDNLMPLIYVPLYTNVYKATMDVLPGAIFLMGAAMTLPTVFVFIWLLHEHRKNSRLQRKDLAKLNGQTDILLNKTDTDR